MGKKIKKQSRAIKKDILNILFTISEIKYEHPRIRFNRNVTPRDYYFVKNFSNILNVLYEEKENLKLDEFFTEMAACEVFGFEELSGEILVCKLNNSTLKVHWGRFIEAYRAGNIDDYEFLYPVECAIFQHIQQEKEKIIRYCNSITEELLLEITQKKFKQLEQNRTELEILFVKFILIHIVVGATVVCLPILIESNALLMVYYLLLKITFPNIMESILLNLINFDRYKELTGENFSLSDCYGRIQSINNVSSKINDVKENLYNSLEEISENDIVSRLQFGRKKILNMFSGYCTKQKSNLVFIKNKHDTPRKIYCS